MKRQILNLIPKNRFFHMTQLIELAKKKKIYGCGLSYKGQ